jgi:hypothetical protein
VRNEEAAKSLKTNDPAKQLDFAANDFNGLGVAVPSRSFRFAKDSVSLSLFLGGRRTERNDAVASPSVVEARV